MSPGKTGGGWGGRRPGAGRKTVLKGRTRFTVHVEKADMEALRDEAADKEVTVGELIRKILGSHLKRRKK
jgi:hypothetical protein